MFPFVNTAMTLYVVFKTALIGFVSTKGFGENNLPPNGCGWKGILSLIL